MAEQEPTTEQLAAIAADNEECELSINYKPPATKSLQEIQDLDKDDESLRKYKKSLLGEVVQSADPSLPNVQVKRLILECEEAPQDMILDLTGDLEPLKKTQFVLKEGAQYRVKIEFMVNKEIVSGLKYNHLVYRKGIKVDKLDFMVGSYGPRCECYTVLSPMDDAPKGILSRGTYTVKSKFTDDDKHDHLSWEWNFMIKKDWTD